MNVWKPSHFEETICFSFLNILIISLHPSFFISVYTPSLSLQLRFHDVCVNVTLVCVVHGCVVRVTGRSSREMLCSRSAQRTLWPEDHGQVSFSQVSNMYSVTADICESHYDSISKMLITYLKNTMYLMCFQVWNRNWANIWITCSLWCQGKEKGSFFCSHWSFYQYSSNDFDSVKTLT